MICCRCLVARGDLPEGSPEPSAAVTVYNGEALCRDHFRHTWDSDQEFARIQLPAHLSGDNIR